MKYLIFLITIFIGDCYNPEPKLCINCKHFIKDHFDIKYSKCKAFPIVEDMTEYLVTGKKEYLKNNHYYCSTSRSSSYKCSDIGKNYEKK